MKQTMKEDTAIAKVNRFVLSIMTIIDLFLVFGYVGDYGRKIITLPFFMTVELIVIGSLIANFIIVKAKPELFKHTSMWCYMLVYAIAVLGAHNDAVYVMAFPITVLFVLYYNYKLVVEIAVGFGGINIIDIIYVVAVLGHMHSGDQINATALLLQGAGSVVFYIGLCGTTRISNHNNSQKLESIQAEQEKMPSFCRMSSPLLQASAKIQLRRASTCQRLTAMLHIRRMHSMTFLPATTRIPRASNSRPS